MAFLYIGKYSSSPHGGQESYDCETARRFPFRFSIPCGENSSLTICSNKETTRDEFTERSGINLKQRDHQAGVQVSSDSWGITPIFYSPGNDGSLRFSNEISELLTRTTTFNSIDPLAVSEYFLFGSILDSKTLFRGIRNLRQGEGLEMDDQGFRFFSCSPPGIKIDHKSTVNDFAADISVLIRNAVNKLLNKNPEACLMLTGGIDTRLILGCTDENLRKNRTFVTFRTPPLEDQEDDDVHIASLIARALYLNHRVEPFPYTGKTFGPWFFEDLFGKQKHQFVAGLFGSEILKGEFVFSMPGYVISDIFRKKLMNLPGPLIPSVNPNGEKDSALDVFLSDFIGNSGQVFDQLHVSLEKEISGSPHENKILAFAINTFIRSFITANWIRSNYNLPFIMPHGTSRNNLLPFIDSDLLTYLLKIPLQLFGIEPHQLYPVLYRNHFSELCRFPTNSSIGKLNPDFMKYLRLPVSPQTHRNIDFISPYSQFMINKESVTRYIYNTRTISTLLKSNDKHIIKKIVTLESYLQYLTNNHHIQN